MREKIIKELKSKTFVKEYRNGKERELIELDVVIDLIDKFFKNKKDKK